MTNGLCLCSFSSRWNRITSSMPAFYWSIVAVIHARKRSWTKHLPWYSMRRLMSLRKAGQMWLEWTSCHSNHVETQYCLHELLTKICSNLPDIYSQKLFCAFLKWNRGSNSDGTPKARLMSLCFVFETVRWFSSPTFRVRNLITYIFRLKHTVSLKVPS